MLKYLKNIKFIGDLSLEDADLLAGYAQTANSILEFGSGGSTQILSQSGVEKFISIETDPQWIVKTQKKLQTLNTEHKVTFLDYREQFDQQFDMIFVDGVDHLRRQFAINTWQYLKTGGVMLFHDTRRFQDFQNAAWVAQLYHTEISKIDVNTPASNGKSSNITVIHKKISEPYINWNETEGKPLWSYGSGEPPNTNLWEYDVKV